MYPKPKCNLEVSIALVPSTKKPVGLLNMIWIIAEMLNYAFKIETNKKQTLFFLLPFFSLSESDMMSSHTLQTLHSSVALKTQQHTHYDTLAHTASKEANLKFVSMSHMPSQISRSERVKVTNPKIPLQQHIQFPGLQTKDEALTTHNGAQEANAASGGEVGDGKDSSEGEASREEAERVDEVTQMFGSKSPPSPTISSASSLVPGTDQSTTQLPSFSAAHTPAVSAVTSTAGRHSVPLVFGLTSSLSVSTQDDATPSEVLPGSSQAAGERQPAETSSLYPSFSQAGSGDDEEPTETSTHTSSTPAFFVSTSSPSPASSALSLLTPLPSFSALTSVSTSSAQSNAKPQLPRVTFPSNASTTAEPRSHWPEHHNITMNATSRPSLLPLSLSRRPVCPYPPVPAHGTFYFRNVENPGPGEYRHYIQYACYPGYTLAHGDVHSYCQQGGTWSGVTPVCRGRWCHCFIESL